jgi:hypothetical protein
LVVVLVLAAAGGLFWFGAQEGWFGEERDAGVIQGKQIPADVVAGRMAATRAVAPEGSNDQILFGDLHVHTTFSADAFQFSFPIMGGAGVHPVADACDFARYCSALDFWSITDHAETITPLRWQRTKDSIRACQKVAGDGPNPDLVSFVGFEWTQVGRLPSEHYGHKNVIFKDLDDAKISPRAIGAGGIASTTLRTGGGVPPIVPLLDFKNRQVYFDFNKFLRLTQAIPDCDAKTPSDKLGNACYETAPTPGELVRRLYNEQKLNPLIIPHGSTWGFYTPPGVTWDKALKANEHPEKFPLVEIFSGHGNSEEYRPWKDINMNADGVSATCPRPTETYVPSCWRAGEIIRERCLNAGIATADCEKRAAQARDDYANMGVAGHVAIGGETPEDWLDAGQCTDCFMPPFNHRAANAVQAGIATSNFDDPSGRATRFHWGFIGSSDNHRARPGTGYKAVDRRKNTEAGGAISEFWRTRTANPGKPEPQSKRIPRDELMTMAGFQLTEFERQSSFWLAGGLAAVHASERSREAIWDSLQRREVYATSGPRILLWFHAIDAKGNKIPMGGRAATDTAPTFEVRAVGAFKQKPGCPDFAKAGLDEKRIKNICSGECYNPSDERRKITRIEVVKVRPQKTQGEALSDLIEDRYLVHTCKPDVHGGCTFTFVDPEYTKGKRDALYYVKAIQEPEPTINAEPVKCERDGNGKCVKATLCYGDYRSGDSECTSPSEHRAWSSPIYLDYGVAAVPVPPTEPAPVPAPAPAGGSGG